MVTQTKTEKEEPKLKERKKVPFNVRGLAPGSDERAALIAKHAKECVPRRKVNPKTETAIGEFQNKWTAFWAAPGDDPRHLAEAGYEPILVEGEHLKHRGCAAYRRPIEYWLSEMEASEELSRTTVEDAFTGRSDIAQEAGLTEVPDR